MAFSRGPAKPNRVGEWANANDVATIILENLKSPNSDRIQRKGAFWNGVRTAHQCGQRGAGRRIAILDSGFDLTLPQLSNATPGPNTKSREDSEAAHGTAVALLVRQVAPDADIKLSDVSQRCVPSLDRVRDALIDASNWNSEVICCSFGFPSDPKRTFSHPNLGEILDLNTDPGTVKAMLKDSAGFQFFEPGGCQSNCEVCDVLDSFGDNAPIVICAAGNYSTLETCPAVHHNAVMAGFRTRAPISRDGRTIEESSGFPSFEQFLFQDMVIEEIPGYEGTSFSSPLIAAFAAIAGPTEFRSFKKLIFVDQVARLRHVELKKSSDEGETLPDNAIAGTAAAYEAAIELLPSGHQWNEEHVQRPCPLCSFLASELIQNVGLLQLGSGNLEAAYRTLGWGNTIAPNTPGIQANLAAVLSEMSKKEQPDRARRVAQSLDAAIHWLEANRIEGSVKVYSKNATDALEHALAIAEMPALPPLQGFEEAAQRLDHPEGLVEAYSGELANQVMMVVGRRAMDQGNFEKAISALQKITENNDSPLIGLAKLHLGLAQFLTGNRQLADESLLQAQNSEDLTVQIYARFNQAYLRQATT